MEFGRLRIERIRHLDRICDAFEADWNDGRGPRIEARLLEVPPGERSVLLGMLLGAELDLRRSRGERPVPIEYHARFPEHAGLIECAFAAVDPPDDPPDGRARPPSS